MYNKELVANIADNIIEEVNQHIDNTIHWQLDPSTIDLRYASLLASVLCCDFSHITTKPKHVINSAKTPHNIPIAGS